MRTVTLFSASVLLVSLAFAVGCNTSTKPSGDGSGKTAKAAGKKRIVFLINTPDPYWEANAAGLKEGAKQFDLEAAGYTVSQDSNDNTAEGQIGKLRQYAAQPDIAAVAISPLERDNESIVQEMRNLQKKGIKVITVDNDVNREQFRDARSHYIGTDNIQAGRTLGTAAKAILEAKGVKEGAYAQFVGVTDADNARARMDGVKEMLGSNYHEVDRAADQNDAPKARDTVRTALTNHKDIVALFGIWAYNAPAIAEVVRERKIRDKVVVATFDAQSRAIAHMEAGDIDVMVVQNPFDMGVQTVRLLKAMLTVDEATVQEMFPNAKETDGDIYLTGLRVVVPNVDSPVKPDLFDEKVVEFMTVEQFKKWLTDRGLSDS